MLLDKEEINTLLFCNWQVPVYKRSPWQLYNMYSRVHIPPYHRRPKLENVLPIICRDIPNFMNFILAYVRL